MQTYTEAAKERAAVAADFTAEKLQDLKVGLVGHEGAVSARDTAPRCAFLSHGCKQPCRQTSKPLCALLLMYCNVKGSLLSCGLLACPLYSTASLLRNAQQIVAAADNCHVPGADILGCAGEG